MGRKRVPTEGVPTNKQCEDFDMLSDLLSAAITEMTEFAKKKPTEELNPYKIKMINRILEPLKDILKNEATSRYLDLLDTETLPTNSDAILVLGQYKSSIKQFREKYFVYDIEIEESRWNTQEDPV